VDVSLIDESSNAPQSAFVDEGNVTGIVDN
jgi:hypothetical protein